MKKTFTPKRPLILMAVFFVLLLSSCRKDEELISPEILPSDAATETGRHGPANADAFIIQNWYNVELKLIKETVGHTPPVAARSLGYTGITLYESVLGSMHGNHSLAGQLNGLSSLPQRSHSDQYADPVIANAALARIIKDLFANSSAANVAIIDSLELAIEQAYSTQCNATTFLRSRNFGRSVADAIFNWSKTDGGYEAYYNIFPTSYIPPTGADKWVPTAPLYQPAMLPYWGSNRTFVPADNAGPVDPPQPPAFSTNTNSFFYSQAVNVYNTVRNLTADQQTIANYWADGGGTFTPPGHNVSISLQLLRNNQLNLYESALLLAKVGIALNDAAIVCWRSKFNSNLLRPVTYINNYIDAGWNTFIGTPPFPSYTSGHSSFSGATARLLSSRFGNHYSFTDSTTTYNGFAPRSYNSFNEAANEAAISRLYGGIHYQFDNDNGLDCGRTIGDNTQSLHW